MQSPFVEPALGRVCRGVRAGELCQESHALQTLAPQRLGSPKDLLGPPEREKQTYLFLFTTNFSSNS